MIINNKIQLSLLLHRYIYIKISNTSQTVNTQQQATMVLRTSNDSVSRNKRSHRDTASNNNSDTTLTTGCSNTRNKRSRLDNHTTVSTTTNNNRTPVKSLLDISAKCVARQYPYQEIEERLGNIPLPVQTRITYHSFPENETSIELYSSNSLHMSHTESNKQPFNVGRKLYETDAVKDVIQIGKSLFCILNIPEYKQGQTTLSDKTISRIELLVTFVRLITLGEHRKKTLSSIRSC